MQQNISAPVRVEETWLYAFEWSGGQRNGFLKVEPLGSEYRNQIAASAALTVAAAAVSGTALAAQVLALDSSKPLPGRFVLIVFNGADASVSVTLSNVITVGSGSEPVAVSGASSLAVAAGTGLSVVVDAAGFGDASPQISGATTSAATNGGTVTVQLRYI